MYSILFNFEINTRKCARVEILQNGEAGGHHATLSPAIEPIISAIRPGI
jgi:hypothetical protein